MEKFWVQCCDFPNLSPGQNSDPLFSIFARISQQLHQIRKFSNKHMTFQVPIYIHIHYIMLYKTEIQGCIQYMYKTELSEWTYPSGPV